jgi:Winged helix DNA-binding domain
VRARPAPVSVRCYDTVIAPDLSESRFASQLLGDERAADPAAVADRLLAVQAQDLRSARLAIRARTRGLTAADVDRCLNERTLVVGWLNRGTLHLVGREDYWWLHALTTPPLFTGNARRLAQTGVAPEAADHGVAAIERALTEHGPLTRDELRSRIDAAGVPTAGQALVHLLMLTCLRGVAVRGPLLAGRHAYVLARDWIGPPPRVDRDASLAELARRYLRGHAPADDRDLAKWAGLPLRDARAGLATIGDAPARDEPGRARTCLLDQWDPVLVGWASRGGLLEHYPRRDSPEAHYRPFAYVRGRAVATWGLRRKAVEIDPPFVALRRTDERTLAADAADVSRFLAS